EIANVSSSRGCRITGDQNMAKLRARMRWLYPSSQSLAECFPSNQKRKNKMKQQIQLQVEELEPRIAPSSANFPPGQFPSGNPAHAPGNSNPNEVPSNNGND